MNRRQFLKESGQFVWKTSVLAAMLSQGKWILGEDKAFADPVDPRLVLLKSIKGPVLLPNDSRYPGKAVVFSKRHANLHPTVIALCENETDLVRTLAWAKENKVPFSVKSGGHSYEGYSTCNGLVIDLSLLNSVVLDPSTNSVTIGAGARLGAIYNTLAPKGYAFVGGTCPFVGIGGHTQGGGYGMLSRQFGLAIDNLLGFRLITADGQILDVSETENSDLFWACRGGGGGNFGLISQFKFKAHPMKTVCLFRATWPNAKAKEAFLAWQTWCQTLPSSVTSHFTLEGSHAGISEAHLAGQFVGTAAEMNTILKPLFAALAPTVNKTWDVTFIQSVNYFAGGDTGAPELFKAKSDYVNRPWTSADLDLVIQNMTSPQTQGVAMLFDHYGGAISEVASDATAFPHREGILFSIQYYTSWSNPADTSARVASLNSFYQTLRPLMSGQAYSNYIDADLENWAEAFYGANLPRLSSIKAKYDPQRFFDFPQAIPTSN